MQQVLTIEDIIHQAKSLQRLMLSAFMASTLLFVQRLYAPE
jgi:hypothetical protein